jgi:hypothetical protein
MGNSQKCLSVIYYFFLILFFFPQLSCNTTEPPDPKPDPALNLELEDVSCTEAWITLTTNNLQLPATLNLIKDNTITKTINLQTADTLLYIDSLLPNTSYQYQVTSIQSATGGPATSNELSVTTLDTTSHNFTWQTFTFGDIGNSVLFDVAVIPENNIWCVGEIRIADNSPIGYTRYSYVKWNGDEWELGKLKYFPLGSIGDSITTTGLSVFAFNDDDVWISGGAVFHWNGSIWKVYYNTGADGSNKIWGTNSNNLYFVGRNGNIIHYNGSQWTKIESWTNVDLKDVWGSPDGKVVWVSGRVDLSKSVLIKIVDGQANIVFEDHYPWQIKKGRISGGILSIWTNSTNFLYVTTPITVYRCLSNTDGEGREIYPYDDYLNGGTVKIRGTATNDIVTSGSNSSILHYNGLGWKRYEELNDEQTYLWSSDKKENITVSVGDRLENIFYYKAIIIVGKK